MEIAARAQAGDKQFNGPDLAGGRIDEVRSLASKVDEDLLARAMHLPHGRRHRAEPRPIAGAELAVGVAHRLSRAILQPELEGHTGPFPFLVQVRPVRLRARGGIVGQRQAEETGFQRHVVQIGRQRPRQASRFGPLEIGRHRAQPHRAGAGDRAMTEPGLVLQAEQFSEFSPR
jgi:hypothetical protein